MKKAGTCPAFAMALHRMQSLVPLVITHSPGEFWRAASALLRARNAALLADRQTLTRQGLSERQIVQCLALRYGLSERSVWDIYKKPAPPPPAQASLLSLPGTED